MVKIITKKRRPRWDNIISLVFLSTAILYLLSMTVIRAQNVTLTKQISAKERENIKLTNDIDNLELEVQKLDNRERILTIAEEYELKINQNNIVVVADLSK